MSDNLFVFDTNVLISAALIEGSMNSVALNMALKTGKVIFSQATFTELTEVIFRKKFDKYLTDEKRFQIIEKFERDMLSFDVSVSISACRDPKGNKFLELAVTAKASYIITGDKDLLVLNPFESISIITPSYFLGQGL